MARSTEDYLDSLLRQAMGIPEPEPEREDILAAADGLTGSNSAILGNAYDQNASFTNEGEIEIPVEAAAPSEPEYNLPNENAPDAISADMMPDSDAPVAMGLSSDIPSDTLEEAYDAVIEPEPVIESEPKPVIESEPEFVQIPDGPVFEQDDNLDILSAPILEEPAVEAPIIEEPVIEAPIIEEPVIEAPIIEEPIIEEPIIEEPVIEAPIIEEPIIEEPIIEEPIIEEPVIEEPTVEAPVIEEPIIEEPIIEEPAAPAITIDDLDPNDSSKALDADMIAALFASANAEEPAPEEPVAEESVPKEEVAEESVPEEEEAADEPVPEEAVAEEPVPEEAAPGEDSADEETAVEEPVIEESAAPAITIDDLDPNDSSKALDADMIAALFASANAEEPAPEEPAAEEHAPEEETAAEESAPEEGEAAAEESVPEEPVAEEPVTEEEAAAEEPAPEEPVAEESAPEEEAAEEPASEEQSSGESLSQDEIEALLAGEESQLEEISIPDEEQEDTPLMADQEISDLLSALDGLSGTGAEEETAEEDTTEESAAADEVSTENSSGEESPQEEAVDSGVDLGGIDMFDTDLSAMLDDVTSSVESDVSGESADASDGSDLNDLLGALDDASGDLSDIGDMLGKDENSELVDPNTETAEALFASDSEEDLFNIDNLIDEEEETDKGRKKKKKKAGRRGKNKKKGNVEDLGYGEMLVDPDVFDIPEEGEEDTAREKKPGFFATLFAKLFEEVEDEEDTSGIEQSAVEIAQEGAAENESILSELDEEDSGDKNKGKKEKKKKDKKDKKDKKGKKGDKGGDSEDEEGEEASGAKKKEKKKEKKKKEKLPEVPGKKLPKKKVVAIALLALTIGIVVTVLAFAIPYSRDISKAKKFYTTGEYQKTYEYMRGHMLTKDDKVLYDRTTTLLRVKRPYDSYQNYMKLGYRMEALNALVQGVQMIDTYAEDAARLGINDKYSKQSRLIYDELYNTFGVTVDRARSWIALEGTADYTRELYECLLDTSGMRDEQTLPEDDSPGSENPIINAEENDL